MCLMIISSAIKAITIDINLPTRILQMSSEIWKKEVEAIKTTRMYQTASITPTMTAKPSQFCQPNIVPRLGLKIARKKIVILGLKRTIRSPFQIEVWLTWSWKFCDVSLGQLCRASQQSKPAPMISKRLSMRGYLCRARLVPVSYTHLTLPTTLQV